MSLRQQAAILAAGNAALPPSTAPCPWMPLDGLIQLWAVFGNDACEMPQSAEVLHATGLAFVALAQERAAFQHCLGAESRKRGEEVFPEHEWSVTALHRAATHWLEVSRSLGQYAASCPQEDEALQHDLRVLIAHARCQRVRVGTIAQHLLQEEVVRYRTQHGIITSLFDEEEEEGGVR